ncbi:hypothetical protein T4E_11050 [Trichinella pseudospiralis]|uniref:Uncharacterized protein n=1 Tax=Trichinella pseudospiralis TaxID=6337 RepID=A0A0V0Y4D5_TRIPS|nr:hypothetical protein T4E_11050 [Trichinella pseudospiralis]
MSELNTDTDGKLAEEPFNANDNNKIKNVQVSHRSKYQWTGKSFTPLFRCRRSDCTSVLEPVVYFPQCFTDILFEVIADQRKIYIGQCRYSLSDWVWNLKDGS